MVRFLLTRFFQSILVLLSVTFISFTLIKLSPADYFEQFKLNPQISPETIQKLRKMYGLDDPLLLQYFKWLTAALRFDLGISLQYNTPVTDLIRERIGKTLALTVPSAVISWVAASFLGLLAGFREGTWIDRAVRIFSYTFMSMPSFFLAFILLFFLARGGYLQPGGTSSLLVGITTLSLISTAGLVRLMRSAVIEVLHSPTVVMLRAKGATTGVMMKHVVRNAMNPFITLIGYEIAGLISGAALIEVVVGWPGLGELMLNAVLSQDLFLVMGGLYIGTIMLIVGNLIADIILALVDPRVREKEIKLKEVKL
ncbi:binding-protein-dependent transport systems inner membrane component [Thermocrinis albus DSM 14484]|uniref:Binding-protein-dependent transport systems inner membrane component n=1 Tax=Thermocrinis albus (strain DSM 14484 / JCM 11386 / HI 11/12) TaxID=638303 RepID=D3SLI5_THEAH|nr:ABC transporter permease [Thermocrinis albus]ADC89615.1 binding-protein-dependent transport systems inner membrane component [Thermocrinis albus DSM 14484]